MSSRKSGPYTLQEWGECIKEFLMVHWPVVLAVSAMLLITGLVMLLAPGR